ncbi:hypothetical protein MTP05_27230 (plasmid) [Enterococcus sp. PLM3]|nr:hypothetical protein MTP05_27230 [Enterococcus sp. PLM3]
MSINACQGPRKNVGFGPFNVGKGPVKVKLYLRKELEEYANRKRTYNKKNDSLH